MVVTTCLCLVPLPYALPLPNKGISYEDHLHIICISEAPPWGFENNKAMKSSPLLGPFCGSEFLGFSLLNI